MVSTVNIRRDVDDAFYRYKMPKLISKIEGKGNGIKTIVPNMSDIAKSLTRPPAYVTKYFGCELGAQVKCDDKNDRYIVNGAHDAEKLQTLLDGFIQRFVLCGSCKNPETDLTLSGGVIVRVCQACGQRSDCDMRHKLTSYIVKNPPKNKKKAYKKPRSGTASPSTSDAAKQEKAGSDDELTRQIEEDLADLPDVQDDDDDWAEDTSAAAAASRMKALALGVGPDVLAADEEGDDQMDEFANFLAENPSANAAEIFKEADNYGISQSKVVAIYVQTVFDENVLEQLPKKYSVLKKLAKSEKQQKALLGGLERLVGVVHKELLSKTSVILMQLYQNEVLDEEVALEWGQKRSKKYVDKETSKAIRKHAKQFLDWLEEADEEDSEEESD